MELTGEMGCLAMPSQHSPLRPRLFDVRRVVAPRGVARAPTLAWPTKGPSRRAVALGWSGANRESLGKKLLAVKKKSSYDSYSSEFLRMCGANDLVQQDS